MALMSGKVYSNTGAPSNADGVDGDIYLRLDGMKTTYRKESGAWVAVGSTLGAIPEIISGVGAPSNALGADEQYYRDTSNQNIYYKQGSMWNLVGNLAGATFAPLLDQAGIGKDLSTPPNLLESTSLNTVIEVGEYHYTSSCTNKPTTGGGLLKVWREDADYIYQIAHISNTGKLSSRYSNDGGANWTSWFDYGRTQGYSDVDFLVSGGIQPNSAVSYAQLSSILGGVGGQGSDFFQVGDWKIKWGETYMADISPFLNHTTTITGFSTISTVLVGGIDIHPTGVGFTVHRKSFDNSSVTVKFDEFGSGTQDCAYWWLAIGK